eukprot:SM000127S26641  [mRNA]  locus=s127:210135:212276:+ [translate_table: standard]
MAERTEAPGWPTGKAARRPLGELPLGLAALLVLPWVLLLVVVVSGYNVFLSQLRAANPYHLDLLRAPPADLADSSTVHSTANSSPARRCRLHELQLKLRVGPTAVVACGKCPAPEPCPACTASATGTPLSCPRPESCEPCPALADGTTALAGKEAAPRVWYPGDLNPLTEWVKTYKDGPFLAKWSHYLDVYHRHFARFIGKPVRIMEIGVQSGGSMWMWKAYFGQQAEIFGIDIDERCRRFNKPEESIRVFIGSQANRTFLREVMEEVQHIDILLDDGGHKMDMQIGTFEELYRFINPNGGVYLCEDVHTSYWPTFGGGLRKRGTYLEYAKNFVDKINGYQNTLWRKLAHYSQTYPPGEEVLKPDDFTASTDSVFFYDSMVVIEKRPHNCPALVTAGNARFKYK